MLRYVQSEEMNKPILIRPDDKLAKQIRDAAKQERRKLGPMVVILLERYFDAKITS